MNKIIYEKNQLGQTSVEYILLVSAMILITYSVFGKINEYVLTNPDSMINTYLGSFGNIMGSPSSGNGGVSGNYKVFRLRK